MANYNKVILMGNLTRDPQLSYTPNNTPVCEFGLAVNRRWRAQDGNQREDAGDGSFLHPSQCNLRPAWLYRLAQPLAKYIKPNCQ